jgi:hypothetical protein
MECIHWQCKWNGLAIILTYAGLMGGGASFCFSYSEYYVYLSLLLLAERKGGDRSPRRESTAGEQKVGMDDHTSHTSLITTTLHLVLITIFLLRPTRQGSEPVSRIVSQTVGTYI